MGLFSRKSPTDAKLAKNVRDTAYNYVWAKYNDEPQSLSGLRKSCRDEFSKAVAAVSERVKESTALSEEFRPLAEILGAETRVPYQSDTWLDVTAEAVAHSKVVEGNPFARFASEPQ